LIPVFLAHAGAHRQHHHVSKMATRMIFVRLRVCISIEYEIPVRLALTSPRSIVRGNYSTQHDNIVTISTCLRPDDFTNLMTCCARSAIVCLLNPLSNGTSLGESALMAVPSPACMRIPPRQYSTHANPSPRNIKIHNEATPMLFELSQPTLRSALEQKSTITTTEALRSS
jgi:hypothetical protein